MQRKTPTLWALGLWSLIALVHYISGYLDASRAGRAWLWAAAEALYYWGAYLSWACFSLWLWFWLKRQAQRQAVIRRLLPLSLIHALWWLPGFLLIDAALAHWLTGRTWPSVMGVLQQTPMAVLFFYLILYLACLMVCFALVQTASAQAALNRSAQLAAEQAQNQLTLMQFQRQLLQSQLGPHFMFNCLSAISALARQGEKQPLVTAVARIGDMLRYSLDAAEQSQVLLEEELAFVDTYVSLQQLRFGAQFSYQLALQPGLTHLPIPPFTLQLLVENAFVHGVEQTQQNVAIQVSIQQQSEQLQLQVCNTQVAGAGEQASLGKALENLRQRLYMQYGERATVTLLEASGLFCSRVCLPLELQTDD